MGEFMIRIFFALLPLLILITSCGGSSSSSSSEGAVLSFEVLSTASTTTAPSANLSAEHPYDYNTFNADDMLYDIYRTNALQLFFGSSASSTAENRPTALGSALATFSGTVDNISRF